MTLPRHMSAIARSPRMSSIFYIIGVVVVVLVLINLIA